MATANQIGQDILFYCYFNDTSQIGRTQVLQGLARELQLAKWSKGLDAEPATFTVRAATVELPTLFVKYRITREAA
jgi:hypothetical protein